MSFFLLFLSLCLSLSRIYIVFNGKKWKIKTSLHYITLIWNKIIKCMFLLSFRLPTCLLECTKIEFKGTKIDLIVTPNVYIYIIYVFIKQCNEKSKICPFFSRFSFLIFCVWVFFFHFFVTKKIEMKKRTLCVYSLHKIGFSFSFVFI